MLAKLINDIHITVNRETVSTAKTSDHCRRGPRQQYVIVTKPSTVFGASDLPSGVDSGTYPWSVLCYDLGPVMSCRALEL
jgi:hypothetical protein